MGKQVADNSEMVVTITLTELSPTQYNIIHRIHAKPSVVRGQYNRIGTTLTFPKKWGRKRGAKELINSMLEDAHTELTQLQAHIQKLETLQSEVGGWKDDLSWDEVPRTFSQ
jgi:DNA repair ATPase RecN